MEMTELANAVCGWLVKKTFNTIVFIIIVVMSFLTARSLLRNIKNVDNYLNQLSPYNSLGDLYPGNSGSGLRMDFPQPIFIQVFQDLSSAIQVEINDVVFDERVPIEIKPNKPIVEKPEKGASLSYVNTFCREVFGSSSNMETCRTRLVDQCNVDIMNWFNVDPKSSVAQIKIIQNCMSKQFNKPTTFMEKLKKTVEEKEVFMKQRVDKRGDSRFWKAGIFIGIVVALVLATWWTVSNYRKYNCDIRAEILRQKISGINESITSITKEPVCDQIIEEPFIKCVKFSTNVFEDAFDQHKLFGYMSLVVVDHSVEELIETVLEEYFAGISNFVDEINKETCDVIYDVSEENLCNYFYTQQLTGCEESLELQEIYPVNQKSSLDIEHKNLHNHLHILLLELCEDDLDILEYSSPANEEATLDIEHENLEQPVIVLLLDVSEDDFAVLECSPPEMKEAVHEIEHENLYNHTNTLMYNVLVDDFDTFQSGEQVPEEFAKIKRKMKDAFLPVGLLVTEYNVLVDDFETFECCEQVPEEFAKISKIKGGFIPVGLIVTEIELATDDYSVFTGHFKPQGRIPKLTIHTDPAELLQTFQVTQVDPFDQNEDLVLPEPPKKELRVDLSWQEEMLHLVRVGLPQVHHCDVDFDVDGDDEGANDENIFVTGLEINPDNPMELRYWRKRLKEIRHELTENAKQKLMNKYPTLRSLGWFNPVKHESETESEDEDKDEALDVVNEEKNDEKSMHRRGSFMAKTRSMSVVDPPNSRRGSVVADANKKETKTRKVSVNVPTW